MIVGARKGKTASDLQPALEVRLMDHILVRLQWQQLGAFLEHREVI
ncbi:hypothetical protein SDC9_161889 [bioreactor metagenome]|uniref:Uncharacterized protein n=1 Tax=bioreactor metagenome TaxID=1076179 RepID=A0A645FLX3_9ZZZZ